MSRDELTGIKVTQEYLKSILHYDPITGLFTWIKVSSKFSKIKVGSIAGGLTAQGYIRIRINGIKYLAHILDWDNFAQKWRAQISVNNKKINLGRYDNINDAIEAYKLASLKYFNEFARM